MKYKQSTPLSFIKDTKHHAELVLWIKINSTAKFTPNSYDATFYDWTYQDIADRTNVPYSTVYKHVNTLLKLGWLFDKNGNLYSKGLNRYKGQLVLVPIHNSPKKQKLELKYILAEHSFIKQRKQIAIKNDAVEKSSIANGKLTTYQRKWLRQQPVLVTQIAPVTLSNKGFGKLLDKSASSGKRLQKALNDAGYIKSTPRYTVIVANSSFTDFLLFKQYNYSAGIRYKANLGIVRQESNCIVSSLDDGQLLEKY